MASLRCNLNVPNALTADLPAWLDPDGLAGIAREVEAAGFDSISVTDHPFPPTDWLAHGGHHALDPFVALSFLAAGSTQLRLMTNVLVLGYRHPITTAKALATLDVLSGGRLTVGTAVGYLEPEFAALDADFAGRAAGYEATVREMEAAWATAGQDEPAGGHVMRPAAVQQPHPPLWVGGNSGAARRRAVELGDGWMPFSQDEQMAAITGTPPIPDAAALAPLVRRLDEARQEAGRPHPLDVCFGAGRRSPVHRRDASDAEVVDELGAIEAAGATWVGVQAKAKTPDDLRHELDRWARRLAEHRGR